MEKKVLFIGTAPNICTGYSLVTFNLTRLLAANNPDMKIIHYGFQNSDSLSAGRPETSLPNLVFYDAAKHEIPQRQGFGELEISDVVRISDPDVIIIFNDMFIISAFLQNIFPVKKNAKILLYVDQVYTHQKPRHIAVINECADHVFVMSENWRTCLVDQGVQRPMSVLRHGTDDKILDMDRNLARQLSGLGLPNDAFVILQINKLQVRKRTCLTIQAFVCLVKANPEKNIFLLLGSHTNSPDGYDLGEILHSECLRQHLPIDKVLGRVVGVPSPQAMTDEYVNILYNATDIGINTCDGEGFGLAQLCHGARGKPQVATRVGGLTEFLDDTCAGLVDPVVRVYVENSRDGIGGMCQIAPAEHYAEKIQQYINNPAILKEHGDRIKERCRRFGWAEPAEELARVIRAVLS